MKRMMILLALCAVATVQAEEPRVAPTDVAVSATDHSSPVSMVGLDFWMLPRDAGSVLQEPTIAQAVRTLLAEPEAYLEIRYPEGEMGELWGQELHAWLVALGVVSDRMELQASSGPVEGVGLVVVRPPSAQEEVINIDSQEQASVPETSSVAEPVVTTAPVPKVEQ